MGMQAYFTQSNILAPPWYREEKNQKALDEFNHGVSCSYDLANSAAE